MFATILFRVFCLPVLLSRNVKSIMFPHVLYGCETCSVTLREGHRLRVFEKWLLRRIFGRVVGCWGRLHNEDLHNMYAPQNIIRVIK
jgi:hypothetical protein